MTPQDIINAAKEWRDENPDKRNYIILTQDREEAVAQADIKTVTDDCVIMLLLMFATHEAYHTAAKNAIEMFKQPHIRQMLNDRYYEPENGITPKITPKNIKS